MDSLSQEEYLARCTVRLQAVGKSGYGTGFFVAPNLILTCAHVVRKNQQVVNQVKLWWQEKLYQAEVKQIPEVDQTIDITLLKAAQLDNQDYLISDFDLSCEIGDEVYTFGYPDHNQDGEPGTFEIVGFTGNKPPLIKFKEGQVRPGFSGSPLLNLRTGKVCGMVNKTRDRSSDLGGKGVPTSVIFTYFPELKPKPILANPFNHLAGRIEDSSLVFGRETEIRRVFELLNTHNSVALIGEPEIGKSSLLKVVEQQAASQLTQPRKPIYLNLGEVYDESDFYYALCDLVGIPELKGFRLSRELEKHKLLLILDNVEKMAWEEFTNQVRSQIRALAEGVNAPLRLVIAANKPLNCLFTDSAMVSPFENVCIEELLSSWCEQTVKNFIISRLKSNPITYSPAEISQIIQASNGHPKTVMRLCYDIYQLYQSKMM
ncbi:MAG: trypsin-like peptidase domain-containing protein [Cyanobacteria bacterium P01_A01_bin.84]